MVLLKTLTVLAPLGAMVLALPLAGAALAGKPIAPYLAFPPTTTAATHAAFSWWVFAGLTLFVAVCVVPFIGRLLGAGREPVPAREPRARRALPAWGWLGLALMGASWCLAWNRFDWFRPFQAYTFSPLWVGYIVVVNALTVRATGRCLLRDRTAYLLALFPLSALFWWLFEYLNRFAENWYYIGVGELGPWEYFWQATLPFSTVLPAVASTREYLASFPRLSHGLAHAWPLRLARPKSAALLALAISGLGLAGIGYWPEYLYPLLWVAPLLAIVSLQVVAGEPTILAPVAAGDWRNLWLAMLAALVCGFFWELWNYRSLAHWEYAVPYVDRFDVFRMPLLGYAGYLPFGLECMAVSDMLDRAWPGRAARRAAP